MKTNAPSNGLFRFIDPNPPAAATFYRLLQQDLGRPASVVYQQSAVHFPLTRKRQRTAALQDASRFLAQGITRQRLGVRLSSAALARNCIGDSENTH